ncbi:putative LRR receptor-like serine/threonine-protein kinase [Capsicum annuum]|uniref:LRR receptor-like serine/threonine-protein kinase n=1 Tax=Capsicum annuum TaxID=4072 RepID=A0A1U8F5Y6_CAPAN|nr:probable LRR receptor-like serine/threonine-protein kinase At1g63430 [Capsicum annuum]KAF3619965.1 putative LRR receptor-like serine/threonine-protein kinase [Capsicum annuum]KAF3642100.1 putative LRR receptor-like serine/threonine-protein kinase [Capsicum annuum]PHT66207.1 putative LRR receptor-like serine/threonine-protein kinase [Capsicum annuum]
MRTWVLFGVLGIVGLFFLTCDAFPSNEVYALNNFREAIYEDPFMVFSNWNTLDSDPCGWSGIVCSMGGDHVIKINISAASLKGFLSPNLQFISSLEELILHGNVLIGTIPKEIGLLQNLKVLDLGSNQLTGPIPLELGNLSNIIKLNLESNGLTGKLPSELGKLIYLQELRLDRNKLKGTLPASNGSNFTSSAHGMYASGAKPTGLCRLSQLRVADFSFNFFFGSIPKCLDYLSKTSFQGNCLQAKDPRQRSTSLCGDTPPAKSHPAQSNTKHRSIEGRAGHQSASKPTWLLVLEVVTGVIAGSLFLVAILSAIQKCKNKSSIIPWKRSASMNDHMTVYVDTEMLKDVVRYSRQELEVACEDFSNIIGSSPDSLVYKGTAKGGPEIAVISLCVKEEQWTTYLELYFQKEVAELARINHENTAKLLGYCRESSPFTRMLVFEYASNGTLYEHLHYGEGCQLSWTRRMKIVIGIAKGLKYLHSELDPPFTISELNSNAVYLTEDFSPKLVDFESWKRILSRSEKNSGAISSEGAMCVLPNSLRSYHLDIQGNIYAFGVLLLEIISGRPPYCKNKGCLVDWAKEFLEVVPEVLPYIVDPELKHFKYEDLKVICEVVNLCIRPTSSSRTSMKDLCAMLESDIDTSITAELQASSLAWAELALSS